MIGVKKNELIIYDTANEEGHRALFNDLYELYDGEMVIIDIREAGYLIAEHLYDMYFGHEWEQVPRDDIAFEINSFFNKMKIDMKDRVEEVLGENNIPYEK